MIAGLAPTSAFAPPRHGPLPKPRCLRIFALVSDGSVLTMLSTAEAQKEIQDLNAAELGAIAHLYRGEIYRSTIWRTRLDNTTNWSIVTMGIKGPFDEGIGHASRTNRYRYHRQR
jgi:hypothetical protein